MTVYQTSTTVSDIKNALANIAATQVAGIVRTYATEPDAPPEGGSVVVGSPTFRVMDDTNAKMLIEWVFPLFYCAVRRSMSEDVDDVESYFLPMLQAYSAWPNQEITPDAFITSVLSGGVTQKPFSAQVFRVLIINVKVTTEFNIPVI